MLCTFALYCFQNWRPLKQIIGFLVRIGFRNNKKTMFFLLLTYPIWSTTILLLQVVRDNILTTVRFEEIVDRLPYLDRDPVKVCLYYYPSLPPIDDGPSGMDEGELARFTSIFGQIQELDDAAIRCATNSSPRACDLDTGADQYLLRRSYIESAEERIWKLLEPKVIRRPYATMADDSTRPEHTLLHISKDGVCLSIDLYRVLSKTQPDAGYFLGEIAEKSSSTNRSTRRNVRLVVRSDSHPSSRVVPFTNKAIRIKIKNDCVHDYSNIDSRCTNDPPVLHRELFSGSREEGRYYFQYVADRCRCIPYSYRTQLAAMSFYPQLANLSYCTSTHYARCLRDFRSTAKSVDIPKSCRIPNNDLTIISSDDIDARCVVDENGTESCTASTLTFESFANYYTIFMQTHRWYWYTIVSLIGGDIGVTVGWSMYSIYEAIANWCGKVCRRLRRRRGQLDETCDENTTTSAIELEMAEFKRDWVGKRDLDMQSMAKVLHRIIRETPPEDAAASSSTPPTHDQQYTEKSKARRARRAKRNRQFVLKRRQD